MVDVPTYQSVFSPLPSNPSLVVGTGGYSSYNSGAIYGPQAQQQQQSQGGGVSDLLSYVPKDKLFNGFNPLGNITSKIDKFGAGIGFSPGTVSYGSQFGPGAAEVFGPSMAEGSAVTGSLGTGATLSGVLGAAGLGALAGGFLNSANPVAGSVGGGAGAAIGMAVGGPIGAIAGGLLGGLGSKLFGKKKPGTNASEFNMGVGKDGTLGGYSYGEKNPKGYGSYNQEFSDYLSANILDAQKLTGIKFKEQTLRGGVNTRHSPSGQPGFITVDANAQGVGQNFGFDPNDPKSRQSAVNQAILAMAQNSGANAQQIQVLQDRINGKGQQTGAAPQIPAYTAPAAKQTGQSFQQFLAQYKSTQNANAA